RIDARDDGGDEACDRQKHQPAHDALDPNVLQLLALAPALDVDQPRRLFQPRGGDGAVPPARGKRVHGDVDRVGGLWKLVLRLPRPPAPDQRFVRIRHSTSPPPWDGEPITRSIEEKSLWRLA